MLLRLVPYFFLLKPVGKYGIVIRCLYDTYICTLYTELYLQAGVK